MNNGVLGFPARRLAGICPQVQATLKLVASGDTVDRSAASPGQTAGMKYGPAAIKAAFNIDRVVYNGTGDITVYFQNAMPDANFVVVALAKAVTAGNSAIVGVHETDTGTADQKRLFIMRGSDAVEQNPGEVHLIFFA